MCHLDNICSNFCCCSTSGSMLAIFVFFSKTKPNKMPVTLSLYSTADCSDDWPRVNGKDKDSVSQTTFLLATDSFIKKSNSKCRHFIRALQDQATYVHIMLSFSPI